MIKVVVTGAGGRMGGRIISFVHAYEDMSLAGAVEQPGHPLIGTDVGGHLGLGNMGVTIDDNLDACIERGDIVIDFTSHMASLKHLEIAAAKKRGIVIGSTGFTSDELVRVEELSRHTPCLLSPNMSVGVNVMFKILGIAASLLGDDYDVEIIEAHHNLKKDAPSGTAVKMAEIVAASLKRDLSKVGVYARKGLIGERSKTEIGIQTLRAGDITGEHTVMFGGVGERLEFIHRAHSRDNFAKGAIIAAKWLAKKDSGLYDMQDVLGLKGI